MSSIKKKKMKAFTLIELVIVIAILALLAAIAIPRYNASRKTAQIVAHNSNVQVLKSAAYAYLAEENTDVEWTGDEGQSWKDYLDSWPVYPKDSKIIYKVTISNGSVTVYPEAEKEKTD